MRPTSFKRKLVEVPLPIRIDKLTEILKVRGVPVYVHWTVILISLIIVINVIRHPLTSLLGLAAYLGVLFIHETGHLIAAQRMHCEVERIRIYPIFGVTEFGTPWSRFDHCVIAWAGVIAQAVVAVPIVVSVFLFGYTRFESVNAVLALLGFFSSAVAIFNLLPISPLDGATAWAIVPEFFKKVRNQRSRKPISRY